MQKSIFPVRNLPTCARQTSKTELEDKLMMKKVWKPVLLAMVAVGFLAGVCKKQEKEEQQPVAA